MADQQEQRIGYAHDTPSAASETPDVPPEAVVDERRRRERANIHGMQGAGTSAGPERPRPDPAEPGAPTVSGKSEFGPGDRPLAPDYPAPHGADRTDKDTGGRAR